MDSDLTMELYFDPSTKLLEIYLPCTGERWIYFLHSYNPSASLSSTSLWPLSELSKPLSSSSSLIEMFMDLSPKTSSVEFYVYVDEMTGLLWICVPYSDEPWRVYALPSMDDVAYPSPVSAQLNYYEEYLPETNLSPSAPIEWSPTLNTTSQSTHLPSPSTPFLGIPTPSQSGNNSPACTQPSPSDKTATQPLLTANSNPALPVPRIPQMKTKRNVSRREGSRNSPTGRRGVRKCATCRRAKKECVYAREEDTCRRCKNRDIADRCVKEEAPERQRLARCSLVAFV